MPRQSPSPLFDPQNIIWLGVQTIELLNMQSTPVHCYIEPVNSKYFPQHLQHAQPMFFPHLTDQVSHPHKTTGEITAYYSLTSMF